MLEKGYYKYEAIKHYSNGKFECRCCGESAYGFLTIDHINNNGSSERRRIGNGRKCSTEFFYKWLMIHNYPEGYRVLCMNCNWGRAINGGICPHIKPNIYSSYR